MYYSMDLKNIKEDLEKAKSAIEDAKLPKELEKIAFSKIMDKILEEAPSKKKRKPIKTHSYKNGKRKKSENEEKNKLEQEKQDIIDSLSRSKYPLIYKLESALDLSLFVLKIVEEEKEIRGLTTGQIFAVLKDTFKIVKSHAAIGMALMEANIYTDRTKVNLGGTFTYKYELMQKGEDYINSVIKKIQQENAHENQEKSPKDLDKP